MAGPTSISETRKKVYLFLNLSFLFLFSLFLKTHIQHSSSSPNTSIIINNNINTQACTGLHDYPDYKTRCLYVQTYIGCKPKGYINYLQIFYCNFGRFPILGHLALLLWLAVLFYVLGNTAADYFCSSLESLSQILKLSPTIAGVTLLSLGNGAADVFSSIVSFTKSGDGDVGLNSVLGGAFFVSSAVVGVISILINPLEVAVDKTSFVRDVTFFLFSLASLLVILIVGRISLLGSIFFVSIYFVYVLVVSATHFFYNRKEEDNDDVQPLNYHQQSETPSSSAKKFVPVLNSIDDLEEAGIPLLGYVDEHHHEVHDQKVVTVDKEQNNNNLLNYLAKLVYLLELPLYLPRRLTIPVVSEERWSKPYAVISVTLAPLLMATLCNTQREKVGSRSRLITYLTAGLIGLVLGNLAFVTTKKCSPPKKWLFPWLVSGFIMSVTWTYITAEELVSLLVSTGNIVGISPSILGLTVLAWGNSLGDLIANAAMALQGGPDGAQIAISGCYAGPMFNTLIGVGVSLVISSWSDYPTPYVTPLDSTLYETLAFLMGACFGHLWFCLRIT
ncbi:hypothetical protein FNV43_RR15370 [Rhamnella rubrinervis]|uniref:Sodium/calcium exchanger membrane region domain-containing protein n=1 Tax=Rhamnella rubrinervis TaxID=2594499 RepID=A0A8K0E3A0_9ROSA|nr:hypothetical protein FNV43_RR15370 [Rhamnella rubrinervis]